MAGGSATVLRDRVTALVKFAPDPRLDRFVAHTYANPPFTSTGARPFWTQLVALAGHLRDVAAWESLTATSATWKDSVPWQAFLKGHYERLAKGLELPSVTLSAEVLAKVAAAKGVVSSAAAKERSAHEAKSTTRLIDAVLQNPLDEAARRVLMDALLEAGDPRGELMTLQEAERAGTATPAQKKRVKELISAHLAEWVGPLAGVIKDAEFSRGFLSRVELKQGNAKSLQLELEKVAGDPHWATVEQLAGRGGYEITMHPVMKSLTSLEDPSCTFTQLAGRHPGLRSVKGVRLDDDALAQLPRFTKLEVLSGVAYPHLLSEVLALPVVRGLRSLRLVFGVGLWAREGGPSLIPRALATGVPEVAVFVLHYEPKDWGLEVRVTANEVALELEVPPNPGWIERVLVTVREVLGVVPAGRKLVARPGRNVKGAQLEELRALVTARGGVVE